MMTRAKRNHRGVHLRCGAHCANRSCHWNDITEGTILNKIADVIAHVAQENDLSQYMREQPDSSALIAQLSALERQVRDLEQQRQRLAFALASGAMDNIIYRSTDDQVQLSLQTARTETDRVREQLETRPDPAQLYVSVDLLRTQLPGFLQQTAPGALNAALRQCAIRVECEDGTVTAIRIG